MSKRSIEILRTLELRGPNIWTYVPALEVWIDIGALEDSPSNTIPGFVDRLIDWLPSLYEHTCSYEERGGFVRRLREGTWPGHILEHVTLELQNQAGMKGNFGKARETSERGVYKVVVISGNHTVSRAAILAARELVLAAMDDRPFDVKAAISELRDLVDEHCLGPSTGCIVEAAQDRRIPSIRLNDGNLVQLGYGKKLRRIWTAETDRTSAIAEGISRDKDLTKRLLAGCGVPVPEGREVTDAEDAWAAAEDIGVPVVVKPANANHGRGVSAELTTREEVMTAYELARRYSKYVLVERFIRGNEHRLLVVGKQMVAAVAGETVWITGDGRSTVRQLLDSQINIDPRRGPEQEFPLDLLIPERDAKLRFELERQGYTAESVPAEGVKVLVQRNGNIAFDVTDQVHPDTARLVALAARVVGLDIAGIDLVVEDIRRPLREQGGAIVEVNAGPGLLMHLKPMEGQPRPVGRAIVDHLFATADDGRIPVVGISGSRGKTTVAKLVAHLMRFSGQRVGLACSEGLYLDSRRLEDGDAARFEPSQRVLMNPGAEVAVIENSFETILKEGLAYDRCQVGVLTRIEPESHYGDYYIDSPERVFNVMRSQIDVVLRRGTGVLNADDPLQQDMAELCDGEVIWYSTRADNGTVASHVQAGGRAVIVRDGQIRLLEAERTEVLCPLTSLPVTDGEPLHATENLLAALAAAWSLGLSPTALRTGAETFDPPVSAAVPA
ncbi:Putative cyanophycin synthetase [Methyloversatilis universalis FAM5]|jgi:cyanophycin synthetase|uniref:Cyanophycin synthetase n=2 Tax=Pseudomonadota TaxID=1224 RepID=F5REH2_METUF|nr:cyanophycin synthetase [Methyloversatilis universalis]EGK71303.1 Putative cyanophycin synthetase [Methyloversatilis universalis FAM5]